MARWLGGAATALPVLDAIQVRDYPHRDHHVSGDRRDERTKEELALEFADVLAWLATIANVVDVDLQEAIGRKYGAGCPGCGQRACTCPDAEKP